MTHGDRWYSVRDIVGLILGLASLTLGLIVGTVALAFGWMAVAWFHGLYRTGGQNQLVDACFQLVALVAMSHGLTPRPSWNSPPIMLAAIAGSWQVYILPFSAIILGLLGLLMARRFQRHTSRISIAAIAARFATAGAMLGGLAVATFLGWLGVHWLVWG